MNRFHIPIVSALIISLTASFSHAQEDDPFAAIDQLLDQQFEETDSSIDEQFERVNRAISRTFEGMTKKIEVDWEEDIKLPTSTEWVTYSADMQSRVAVNFNEGIYVAEVLVQNSDLDQSIAQLATLMQDLQQARDDELNKRDTFLNELDNELRKENILDTTENTSQSKIDNAPPLLEEIVTIPSSDDLKEAVAIKISSQDTQTLATTATEAATSTPLEVKTLPAQSAPTLTENIEIVKDQAGNIGKIKVNIKFVNNYQKKILTRYLGEIKRIANDFDIDISTVLAIMETESSFNPRATSPIPAFGLMQVVPSTAGIDAYRHIYGEKKLVSAEFLYDEINNILMGTAYFNLLDKRYLRRIENGQSRFYCAVASYNTGVGNLARTFIGKKDIKAAARHINTLAPEEVYDHLLNNLPAEETRNYLRKITARAEKYKSINWDVI